MAPSKGTERSNKIKAEETYSRFENMRSLGSLLVGVE